MRKNLDFPCKKDFKIHIHYKCIKTIN